MRGPECLALILGRARHEHSTGAVREQLGHDLHALLGRLARPVHRLGGALTEVTVMVDESVANIAERKSGQAVHRVVGRHATLRHVEHQLAKRVGVHDPHARTG